MYVSDKMVCLFCGVIRELCVHLTMRISAGVLSALSHEIPFPPFTCASHMTSPFLQPSRSLLDGARRRLNSMAPKESLKLNNWPRK